VGGEAARKPGLRERKKRQTENEIELAGVELALANGHHHVTVADICKRAGVSRSTFFNYMPTREAAIFGKPLPPLNRESAEHLLNLVTAGASVLHGVAAIVAEVLGGARVNPVVAAARFKLISEQPDALPILREPLLDMFDQVAKVLRGWLESHPEQRISDRSPQREASMLVGIAGVAFQDVLDDFRLEEVGTEDRELATERWDEALELMETLLMARHAAR